MRARPGAICQPNPSDAVDGAGREREMNLSARQLRSRNKRLTWRTRTFSVSGRGHVRVPTSGVHSTSERRCDSMCVSVYLYIIPLKRKNSARAPAAPTRTQRIYNVFSNRVWGCTGTALQPRYAAIRVMACARASVCVRTEIRAKAEHLLCMGNGNGRRSDANAQSGGRSEDWVG